MYLRTTSRRNADGSVVRYHQLAENVWDPRRGCAVAKIIYNFGRADQVDGDKMRRLAASIMRAFGGEEQAVATDGVRLLYAWPYGGLYVLEQLWKELGIDTLLSGLLRAQRSQQPFERALFVMVANRALLPYSKLYCWEQWLREEVFLPDASELELHHLYRAMDFFESNKLEVEKAVYFKTADLTGNSAGMKCRQQVHLIQSGRQKWPAETMNPHPRPSPKGEGVAASPSPLGEGRGEGQPHRTRGADRLPISSGGLC